MSGRRSGGGGMRSGGGRSRSPPRGRSPVRSSSPNRVGSFNRSPSPRGRSPVRTNSPNRVGGFNRSPSPRGRSPVRSNSPGRFGNRSVYRNRNWSPNRGWGYGGWGRRGTSPARFAWGGVGALLAAGFIANALSPNVYYVYPPGGVYNGPWLPYNYGDQVYYIPRDVAYDDAYAQYFS